MNKKSQKLKYIIADLLSTELVWFGFFIYFKSLVYSSFTTNIYYFYNDINYWIGFFLYPFFWIFLYVLAGMYRNVYRKTRLIEFEQSLVITLVGFFILSFILFIEEYDTGTVNKAALLFIFFVSHLILTYLARLIITHRTIKKIHRRQIGFNTILIGSGEEALKVFSDLENQKYSSGNKFVGFVNGKEQVDYKVSSVLPYLGSIADLPVLINEFKVEEVVIAIEEKETKLLTSIITQLELFDVVIKINPRFHDYIFGNVKTSGIFETPLIEISPDLMPAWQFSVKRILDIVLSVMAIVLLSPIFIITAIGVKLSSKGPILYAQERVGKGGKKFKMIKFRSMYRNSELEGPQLSSKTDKRITPFGSYLRRLRVDEIPQFFTVLKGDMSLVGPRPEREYFINQMLERAPHFKLMQKVKPGMTSWGQVKFGYAENIEEMIERIQYDILYLENMSLALDFKIMIWTALIVMQGRGK